MERFNFEVNCLSLPNHKKVLKLGSVTCTLYEADRQLLNYEIEDLSFYECFLKIRFLQKEILKLLK